MLPAPTPLESVVLRSGNATVYIAPARGGMATRFYVGERPIFYLDEATLLDTTKNVSHPASGGSATTVAKSNVRGGAPVLFPSPGKLEGDAWAQGKMGQHGFARNAAWEVSEQTEDAVTLRLVPSEATRAVYPWDFVARYTYRLNGPTLRIEQRFENYSEKPMPFGAGFHPYFAVAQADKANARIPTAATRAFDNTTKKDVDLPERIDLTAKEVDLHLLGHGSSSASMELRDGRVDVRCSPEFKRWVVWTLEGKDFVCLEPWTAPGNALNTGDDLLFAPRGEVVVLWTQISFS